MPIRIGTVAEQSPINGVLIHINNSQEVFQLSEEQLRDWGHSDLQVGSVVRLTIQDDKVEKVFIIPHPKHLDTPLQFGAVGETATVVGTDPRSGVLIVILDSGKQERVAIERSSNDDVWSRLRPGAKIVLHREQGHVKLELSQQQDRQSNTLTSTKPVNQSLHIDGRLLGTIEQIAPYFTTIGGDDGRRYMFLASVFPAHSFAIGDRVLFDADEQSGEIKNIAILESKPSGRGYPYPCQQGLAELMLDTKRPAIAELARHFCEENRIEWYWITPKRLPEYADSRRILSPAITRAIREAEGFDTFFSHQTQSLDALRLGKHVLVLTPTASGKTNCYNPAVFDTLQGDPAATALYIFPLNALLMDQMKKLESIGVALQKQGIEIPIQRLIGGLDQEERHQIRDNPPQILAVNPEKLHDLLYDNTSGGWGEFLRRLRFVVLDEVHSYRSLFGLQMAGILRRLQIASQRYQNPGFQFVLSSATVGAPEELATRLTGISIDQFEIIGERADRSAQQQRHWIMLTPDVMGNGNLQDAHVHQAALTLADVLTIPKEKLNAIVFAKSFREVRMIYDQAVKHLRERGRIDLVRKVEKYASGLMDIEQKRKVYQGLNDGTYQAVVSTNALEAGIDIKRLDICIVAGFPFHMMRLRQMAGRAGRKQEGAVIYIPSAVHSLDRFYRSQPERLLTQPPEAFVIDAENPSIARKHVVAAASSMSAGVTRKELSIFGKRVDEILDLALAQSIIERTALDSYTAKKIWDRTSAWAVGNLRSNEQAPYILCTAPTEQRHCMGEGCPATNANWRSQKSECSHHLQSLDRQYIYREAHPGAIYEALESGDFYRVIDLHDAQRVVSVQRIGETLERTFGVEEVSIDIRQEKGRRELGQGLTLVWGEVVVTRTYTGFYSYELIPRRWCKRCQCNQDMDDVVCSECGSKTVSYLDKTVPEYHDYPSPNENSIYTLTLNTVACWLMISAEIESSLKPVSRCQIPGPNNRVSVFLQTPRFDTSAEVEVFFKLSPKAAQVVFDYLEQHHSKFSGHESPKGKQPIYPIYYGQCLHHELRQALPENEASAIYQTVTGYPLVKDDRHICRNCIGSTLLPAAHTLEHLIAKRYPTVALGDSQDISSTTTILHPQTRSLTTFWFDNYEGGIGATEKIYGQFNRLLREGIASLSCDCTEDHGCPLCIQQSYCDRENDGLSKVAVRALIQYMQNKPISIPIEFEFWDSKTVKDSEDRVKQNERAKERVHMPEEPQQTEFDPFALLRVQKHVHDDVLTVAEKIRSGELSTVSPPIPIAVFQRACERVKLASRPTDWQFPEEWDDYQLLHIHPQASSRLVNKAKKAILKSIHPDRYPDKQWANAATIRVNAAWDRIKGS